MLPFLALGLRELLLLLVLPLEPELDVLSLLVLVSVPLEELLLGQLVAEESDIFVVAVQLLLEHDGSDVVQSVVLLPEHDGSAAGSQSVTLPEGGLVLLMQTDPVQPVLGVLELPDDPEDVLLPVVELLPLPPPDFPLLPLELLPPPLLVLLPLPLLPLPEGEDALLT